jgi:hypothetical protein
MFKETPFKSADGTHGHEGKVAGNRFGSLRAEQRTARQHTPTPLCLITAGVSLLLSCGAFRHHDNGTTKSPTKAQVVQRVLVYQGLTADPYALTERCDSLTFVGAYVTGLTRLGLAHTVDLSLHDYSVENGVKTYGTGEIHRSKELCHVDSLPNSENDSRSECSQDGVLSWCNAMAAQKNFSALLRAIDRAEANGWRWCVGGPDTYVQTIPLAPLMRDIRAKVSGRLRLAQEADALPSLDSFRGNVLFSYVALKGQVFGYLNPVEMGALATLQKSTPSNPAYKALFHRYGDGNQGETLRALVTPFWPLDRLPSATPNQFAWGIENSLLYTWAAGWL